jgi:lipoprotein-anchoring transpeptidase ErfK/SrfK
MCKGWARLRVAWFVLAAAIISAVVMTGAAEASVSVRIDISRQTMSVTVDGWPYATWRVSTARRGYWTPRGAFQPFLLKRMHYSSRYENSPMPHSIFFRGNFAIHGTGYVRSLGRPASHGCVRLDPRNAARLFDLVRQYGISDTRIFITN